MNSNVALRGWGLFALVVSGVFLSACAMRPTTVPRPIPETVMDCIALCGAGLDAGVRAKIEARLHAAGGNLTVGYDEHARAVIFDSDEIDGADKQAIYDRYTGCLNEQCGRLSCPDICNERHAACQVAVDAEYQSCLAEQMAGCKRHCERLGFSEARCVVEFCDWESIGRKAKASYKRHCNQNRTILDMRSNCAFDKADCLEQC